jgi:hypothetical protein
VCDEWRKSASEREKKEEGTSIKLILYGFMEGILLVVIFVVCARCCETHRTEKQPKFILNFLSKHFSPISHQSASKLPSLPPKRNETKKYFFMQIEQSFSKTYKSRDHPLVSVVLLADSSTSGGMEGRVYKC